MNTRALLHSLSAACAAIALGTIKFAGLGEGISADIVGIAAIIVIVVDTYLASTSTGVNAASK